MFLFPSSPIPPCQPLLKKTIKNISKTQWSKQEFKNILGLISKLGKLIEYQVRSMFMEKV